MGSELEEKQHLIRKSSSMKKSVSAIDDNLPSASNDLQEGGALAEQGELEEA